MKNIFKLSGLLITTVLFFSSCSKNQIAASSGHQENLAKLSLELEQNYGLSSLAAGPAKEEGVIRHKEQNTNRETPKKNQDESFSPKARKINSMKALKTIRQFEKSAANQKLVPQKLNDDNTQKGSSFSQRMKLGLLLGAVGLIIMLVLGPLYWIGAILLVIGLVLIVMELLDM
jgi:hypothetical protein